MARPRKPADHLRDGSGGLVLGPDGDGVAVVLHHEQDGQVQAAGAVERLPELTFAGRPLAQGDVGDLVAVGVASRQRPALDVPGRLGAPDRGEALRTGGGGLADDVGRGMAPVARHLPARRGRVLGRADRLEEDLPGRDPEGEDERPVPVVGEEPVVAGPQRPGQAGEQRLMAGAGDLEEGPALLLEDDLPVVERPGDVGRPQVGKGFGGGDPAGQACGPASLRHASSLSSRSSRGYPND